MRYFLPLLFFQLFAAVVPAQKAKPATYFYTTTSDKFLTDRETDSLFFTYTGNLFNDNAIPRPLFEKHYGQVKARLVPFSQKVVTQAFRDFEKTAGKKLNAVPGTTQFDSIKSTYRTILDKAIRQTFQKNASLYQYLYSSNSDRITSFKSTVRVKTDGKLLVTEEIRIYNGNGVPNPVYGSDPLLSESGVINNEIQRGIVRTFPLIYINKYKLFQNTTFKLLDVLRNGEKEEHHTEKKINGIALFTGNKYKYLQNGFYTYAITYETDHQLKFLKNFDELFWNVTGSGWSFRIDTATCTIILPKGAKHLSGRCYTGKQGEKNEDCSLSVSEMGDSTIVFFKTNKALLPNHGISVACSWPKGFVKTPGAWQQLKYYVWNNRAVFLLPIAALVSFIFCFIFWLKYGRDPKAGVIYPAFEPPPGYSPAALGYIYFQKFSGQLVAATIVDAAVRNKIRIDVEREGLIFKHNEYIFSKSSSKSKPPFSNYEDFDSDIDDLIGTRVEKGTYNSSLADLNKKVRTYCEDYYKRDKKNRNRGFFFLNDKYLIFPGVICFALGIWALIETMGAMAVENYWQAAYFVAGVFLCVFVFKLFRYLLKAYNPEGRKMRDKIEGFRMFLATADENRFDTMAPPEKSLGLFEKYLPFAIALDCEVAWGNKFEKIIDTAVIGGEGVSSFTQQYRNDDRSFNSSFTSGFSGTISSASTPPSSSSGGGSSFGGGSSGGGGGGGGGGGW